MVRPANCRHNETAGASSGRDKRYMIAAESDGSVRTKKLTTGGHTPQQHGHGIVNIHTCAKKGLIQSTCPLSAANMHRL